MITPAKKTLIGTEDEMITPAKKTLIGTEDEVITPAKKTLIAIAKSGGIAKRGTTSKLPQTKTMMPGIVIN